jgi:ankyrin repeat protein
MAMMLFDRQDIDVNTPYDHNGNTAVHMSWSFGNSAADIEIAKKILTHNPNLEAENEYGDTPLIYNVDQGKIEMVKLLVATKGIDLNHPDKTMRRTPLGLAKYRKDTEIAGLLQKAGAKEYSIRYFYKNLPVPGRIAVVIIGYVLPLLPTILLIISKTLRSKPLMIASLVIGILPVIAVIKLARTPLMVDDLNISPIILLMVCVPWLVIRTPAYLVCRIEDEKFKRLNFFLYTMSAIDALVLVVACIIGFGIVKQ